MPPEPPRDTCDCVARQPTAFPSKKVGRYAKIRGFQHGVRVPLGVREGLSGGTRAPFYLLKKKIFHNSSAGDSSIS